MHPWFFESVLGDGKGISAYLTMWAVAGIVCIVYMLLSHKKFGFDLRATILIFLFAAVFGILGASVFSFLFRIGEVLNGSVTAAQLLFGTYMYYGGFLGGVIGLILFAVREKMDFFAAADFGAIILPLAHGIGRIGCYCAGCCYGIHSEAHGIIFPSHYALGYSSAGIPVLPIMLYEAIFNAVLFLVLIFIFFLILRKSYGRNTGAAAGIYCISYAVFRFVIEYWRGDVRGSILGLSTSQFISVLVFLGGIYLLTRYYFIRRDGVSEQIKKYFFIANA